MQHPTVGGLKRLTDYAGRFDFILTVVRVDVFKNAAPEQKPSRLPKRSFTDSGDLIDLSVENEQDSWKLMPDVSLSHPDGLYQILFFSFPHEQSYFALRFSDSFSVAEAHLNGASEEGDRFYWWFIKHQKEIQEIAWRGKVVHGFLDRFNCRCRPKRYAKLVFRS